MIGNAMPRRALQSPTLQWLVLGALGTLGGLGLGAMTVGDEVGGRGGSDRSYSLLSGNPASLSVDSHPIAPCDFCADSYGVAARLAADDDADAMDASFRELGTVAFDPAADQASNDDYRFGGRFPDAPAEGDAGEVVVRRASDVVSADRGDSDAPPVIAAVVPAGAVVPPSGDAPPAP